MKQPTIQLTLAVLVILGFTASMFSTYQLDYPDVIQGDVVRIDGDEYLIRKSVGRYMRLHVDNTTRFDCQARRLNLRSHHEIPVPYSRSSRTTLFLYFPDLPAGDAA